MLFALNHHSLQADYAPPEVWQSQAYVGPEVDVWSLGVVVYVMVTGYVPFNSCAEGLTKRRGYKGPFFLSLIYFPLRF